MLRRVGRVAHEALGFLHGRVDHAFRALWNFVTAQADLFRRAGEEGLDLRAVRVVANGALPLAHGWMNVLARLGRAFVTGRAYLPNRLRNRPERVPLARVFMAGLAHLSGHRAVDNGAFRQFSMTSRREAGSFA
jgi:hypothetical protein